MPTKERCELKQQVLSKRKSAKCSASCTPNYCPANSYRHFGIFSFNANAAQPRCWPALAHSGGGLRSGLELGLRIGSTPVSGSHMEVLPSPENRAIVNSPTRGGSCNQIEVEAGQSNHATNPTHEGISTYRAPAGSPFEGCPALVLIERWRMTANGNQTNRNATAVQQCRPRHARQGGPRKASRTVQRNFSNENMVLSELKPRYSLVITPFEADQINPIISRCRSSIYAFEHSTAFACAAMGMRW